MPQPAPFGIIGKARQNLRDLLAESVSFQGLVGVFTAAEAKEFIYFAQSTPAEESLPDVFAVIGNRFDEGPDSFEPIATGNTAAVTGAVGMIIYSLDAPGTLEYNEITRILNNTDQVLAEMNAVRESFFDFRHVDVWQPMLTNEDDRSSDRNYILRAFQFHYGPSPG